MRNESGRFWSVEHLDVRGQVPDARTTWSSTWVVDTRVVKGDRPPASVIPGDPVCILVQVSKEISVERICFERASEKRK